VGWGFIIFENVNSNCKGLGSGLGPSEGSVGTVIKVMFVTKGIFLE
jgi:hypothetical protein